MGAIKIILCLVLFGMVLAKPQWYTSKGGKKYFIEADQKYNWLAASQACTRRNLQLAEIKSLDKNEDLVELLKSVFGHPINLWLGANDEFNTNKDLKRPFYWSSSGKRMDYTNWIEGGPANANSNEHCVHVCGKSKNFEWNDLPCTKKIGYICEEHRSDNDHRNSMQEKSQKILDITKKLFESEQHEQKRSMEKITGIVSQVVQKNNEITHNLERIQQNMENGNSNRDVKFHNRELRSHVEAALQTVHDMDGELEKESENFYSKFSKKFSEAQKAIEHILGNKAKNVEK
uniref:C-type lectin domain-containing protein n=1 Tax=Stomoxys calcitrans TaxID=35570 RepID=A0A1I8NZW5_STOCA